MTYDEINSAIASARTIMREGERIAKQGVEMSVGRLERLQIDRETLVALKRELTRFDSHTGKWK